jgi:DNA replication protein DnaC
MRRLDEILSSNARRNTSEDSSDILPGTAEAAEPVNVCATCGGAGFVRRARSVDDPRFGRAEPCDCVLNEAEEVRRDRLQRIGKLGALSRFAFVSLDEASAPPAFRSAVEAARAYADDPAGWLVITGPSGSGKTRVAAAIANAIIERGEAVLFTFVPDLLDHLRASYDATSEESSFSQLFDQVRNAPLLILDDIEASSPTPWAMEKLFQLVNSRYNDGLSTVFTCTSPVSRLEDRLATRLGDDRLSRHIALPSAARGTQYRQVGGMTRTRLEEMKFNNFNVQPAGLQPEELSSLEAAFRISRAYAEDPQGWLVLQGDNGCGKTHLAAAVANQHLRDGGSVFFAVVPELLDHLRRAYAPRREAESDDLFDHVREADLVILDELGPHSTSPWAREKLDQVVGYRTAAGLPTVVTTDQSLDAIQEAHPRIFARIADSRSALVSILAPHYRLGPRAQRHLRR